MAISWPFLVAFPSSQDLSQDLPKVKLGSPCLPDHFYIFFVNVNVTHSHNMCSFITNHWKACEEQQFQSWGLIELADFTVLDWNRHADIPSNFVMLFDNNRWWAWILQVWDPWRKEDSQCSYWKRRSVQVWGCWTCRLLFVLIFLGELQRDKEYLQSQERFPQPQQGDVVPSHPENGAEDLASNISLYQCYQSGASDLWSRGCRYNLQISRSIVSTSFF